MITWKMPFGIRFKRTRRYEISSKNALVIGVHMLDNSYLECTLTSESTGQQCLDSIAQRIELEEVKLFIFLFLLIGIDGERE